ncbi:MAG: hypothetical protein H6680_02010 [Desulfobacteraceae bacterium]|nr:hypothetical protein [Desulfobacteraceae bacterium]
MNDQKEKNNLLFRALKKMNNFKIKHNSDCVDLNKTNPGWQESEKDYIKKQREWLNKVNKKKDDF